MSELAEFLEARFADDDQIALMGGWEPFPADCWTPDRVEAEIRIKRAIVALHTRDPLFGGSCSTCTDASGESARWPCSTLRILASVYADQPGYREEWKP